MKPDQERVKNLLTDTVTLLCRNGLQFQKRMKVQGLLGITLDDNEVFLVQIDESFGSVVASLNDVGGQEAEHNELIDNGEIQQTVAKNLVENSELPSKVLVLNNRVSGRAYKPVSQRGRERFGRDITALRRKKFLQQGPRDTTNKYANDNVGDSDNLQEASRSEDMLAASITDDVRVKVEHEDDVILVDEKPSVDEPNDRQMMRGAYLAEASTNESLLAQDIYSQFSFPGATGNNEDVYATGLMRNKLWSVDDSQGESSQLQRQQSLSPGGDGGAASNTVGAMSFMF
jgi:hypothetical protein